MRVLDNYMRDWYALRHVLAKNNDATDEAISYTLNIPKVIKRRIKDYSLVYDEGIFKYKPPVFLKYCMSASYQGLLDQCEEIINWEARTAKHSTVTDWELSHVLLLKDFVDRALRFRFPDMTLKRRKQSLSGEYKTHQSHFKR